MKTSDSNMLQMLQDLVEDKLRRGEVVSHRLLRWYARRLVEIAPNVKSQ